MKIICTILLLASLAVAKDKSLNNYPYKFTVVTQDLTGRTTFRDTISPGTVGACDLWIADDSTLYHIENRNPFTCHTWIPGTILNGRLASTWGVPFIEFAWTDDKGKINTQKYTMTGVPSSLLP